jgi:ribokinase
VVHPYPELDFKTRLLQFSQQGGGPAATAIATLSVLEVKASFIGKISDDDYGRFILKEFKNFGVDTSFIIIDKGKISPFSFIAIEATSGRRTIFWTPGTVSPLEPKELNLKIIREAEVLLIDGHHLEAQIQAAKEARTSNTTIILDAGSLKPGIEELISLSDILIASERFAAEYIPEFDLNTTLLKLKEIGPKICIISLGPEGSIGIDERGEFIQEPAIQLESVVDTTGAGDVYHGAFAYSILQKSSLKEAMEFATIVAGLSCTQIGGRAGIPTLKQIKEYKTKIKKDHG